MMKKTYYILAIIAVLALLAYGCEKTKESVEPIQQAVETAMEDISEPAMEEKDGMMEEAMEDTMMKEPEVKEFTVTAKRFEFIPSTIRVNKGDTVILHVTSIDVAHGLRISEFGINERLEPGQTVDIEFVADKEGSFSMVCSVFCGSGHGGMRGTLIVE